jgi:hypothetical protein
VESILARLIDINSVAHCEAVNTSISEYGLGILIVLNDWGKKKLPGETGTFKFENGLRS